MAPNTVYRFLFILLTVHRKTHPEGEFSLVSLLEDLGFDAYDWSFIPELHGVWEEWYEAKSQEGLREPELSRQAKTIAAARVGSILARMLEKDFTGLYVQTEKEPSQFGGRNKYQWVKEVG